MWLDRLLNTSTTVTHPCGEVGSWALADGEAHALQGQSTEINVPCCSSPTRVPLFHPCPVEPCRDPDHLLCPSQWGKGNSAAGAKPAKAAAFDYGPRDRPEGQQRWAQAPLDCLAVAENEFPSAPHDRKLPLCICLCSALAAVGMLRPWGKQKLLPGIQVKKKNCKGQKEKNLLEI